MFDARDRSAQTMAAKAPQPPVPALNKLVSWCKLARMMTEMTAPGFREKVRSAHDVASRIQSGDVVVVSGGATQPIAFLDALGRRTDLKGVTLYTSMTLVPPTFLVRQFVTRNQGQNPERNIRFCSLLLGPGDRDAAVNGVVDQVPVNIGETGTFFRNRRVDVIVLGSSGPDPRGGLNFSCTVDWMPDALGAGIEQGALVIAEINPTLPMVYGESNFPLEMVDHVVESTIAPADLPVSDASPAAPAIGGFLSTLVPDGATLQLGLGALTLRSALYLESRRNLGVYSDYIGDAFLYLAQKGAVIGGRKAEDAPWRGSFVLGTRKLYRFANGNRGVHLLPVSRLTEMSRLAAIPRLVSVTEAASIDLSGQVCGDPDNRALVGNPGSSLQFHRGASVSKGGRGIVVLESTDPSGRRSKISSQLPPGAAVSIPRGDVDTVVTEYGVAKLKGKSASERALTLIAIAHPAHRERLAFEARKLRLFD